MKKDKHFTPEPEQQVAAPEAANEETAAVEDTAPAETTEITEAAPEAASATPAEAAKSKRKRKPIWIAVICFVSVIVLALGALAVIAEPWVPAAEPVAHEPTEIVCDAIQLAVGDTQLLDFELGDNEMIYDIEVTAPACLKVTQKGRVLALAEYQTEVTVTTGEIEVLPPQLSGIAKLRSELRLLLGVDPVIDYAAMEPQVLNIYTYPVEVKGYETIDTGETLNMPANDIVDLVAFLNLPDNVNVKLVSDDLTPMGVAVLTGDPCETTLTVIYSYYVTMNDLILPYMAEMPFKAETYSVVVTKAETNNSGSGTGSGATGSSNTWVGGSSSGTTSTSGGSSAGGTSNSDTGGDDTIIIEYQRPYALPSQAEVEAFCAQLIAYGQSLGLGVNSGLTLGNSGWSPPASTWLLPWSTTQSDAYWQVDRLYSMFSAEPGFYPDAPVFNVTWQFNDGEYDIYVMYG